MPRTTMYHATVSEMLESANASRPFNLKVREIKDIAAYSVEEGGYWIQYGADEIDEAVLIFALRFKQGQIFDLIVGWR